METYTGTKLIIEYVDGAEESWDEMLRTLAVNISKEDARKKLTARLIARIMQLANGGQLRSPDHWNKEGNLPDGKFFYAIKANHLRAYGWYSSKHKGTFFISHFIYKDQQKLAAADTGRVCNNWHDIEG